MRYCSIGKFLLAALCILQVMSLCADGTAEAWEGAPPLKWRISDGRDGLAVSAVSDADSPVVLFVDPVGDGSVVYRTVFQPDGRHRDARAVDNNTNTDTFNYDLTWRSRASVKTHREGNGGWRLDAVVPYAALETKGMSREKWGVCLSSDERVSHPSAYPKRPCGQYAKVGRTVALNVMKGSVRKIDGKLRLTVRAVIRGLAKTSQPFTVRLTVESSDGDVLDESEATASVSSGDLEPVQFDLGVGKAGEGDSVLLRGEVFSSEGVLQGASRLKQRVIYAPVVISMIEPCYRDCVFESMDLRRLVGVAAFLELEKAGFDQLPCCSNWAEDASADAFVAFCKERIDPSRLKGFCMAPWSRGLNSKETGYSLPHILNGLDLLKAAREKHYGPMIGT